jgi:hypothetical protein
VVIARRINMIDVHRLTGIGFAGLAVFAAALRSFINKSLNFIP